MQKILNYIGGEFQEAISGKLLDNVDPSVGKVYSTLPDSAAADVDLAVRASKKAFADWAGMPVENRSKLLNKLADLMERDLEKLALAECIDNGKPLWLARETDIPRAISNFRFFAAAAQTFTHESSGVANRFLNYTLRQPVGIIGCISPWNLPLYLITWKIAPALATGNCVIAKPSEITPMTAFLLCELAEEAGIPAGVLNMVHGLGGSVGEALSAHPEIKAISFTGGTVTGRKVAATAAPLFKKLSLELGGKNPNVIFADCDFDKMIATTVRSSFQNQGQICLCGSRILVEKEIYEKFKAAFIAEVKQLKLGDPLEESSRQGAIVSKVQYEKVLACIELAKQEGGIILCGGKAIQPVGRCAEGYFIEPTIIENLPANCRTNQEEIFGPVVTIMPFEDEKEAIQLANSTTYGLAATIWTSNVNKAHRVSAAIDSGIIWVNTWMIRDLRTPFGGVKDSGVGREGGDNALRFCTEAKNVCLAVE